MSLKLAIVLGGIVLFGAMLWDRLTGRKATRTVLTIVLILVGGIIVISQLVAFGGGP
jgi:hypothetical protein